MPDRQNDFDRQIQADNLLHSMESAFLTILAEHQVVSEERLASENSPARRNYYRRRNHPKAAGRRSPNQNRDPKAPSDRHEGDMERWRSPDHPWWWWPL